VVVVEHDLTILDAVSDSVCCLFGEPGAYGVCTQRMNPAQAINQYCQGYFPALNMRFRSEPLDFSSPAPDEGGYGPTVMGHPSQSITLARGPKSSSPGSGAPAAPSFILHIEPAEFRSGEIITLLGENGCGKSTWMDHVAANNDGRVSHKPQMNAELRCFQGTVQALLEESIGFILGDRMFNLLVRQPLRLEQLEPLAVKTLSGGELQRVSIAICLGTPAACYLLDEPSAGLDCEQRLIVTKVLHRYCTMHLCASVVVIEHDLLMVAAISHRIVGFEGTAGVECTALAPVSLTSGLDAFLREVDITIREDPNTGRPRLNRKPSGKHREQRKVGVFYQLRHK
jgi:ATP-binding cassette subfamily E protein 1